MLAAMTTNVMDVPVASSTTTVNAASMPGMDVGGSGDCQTSVRILPRRLSFYFLRTELSYDYRCSGIGTRSTRASCRRHGTSPREECLPVRASALLAL